MKKLYGMKGWERGNSWLIVLMLALASCLPISLQLFSKVTHMILQGGKKDLDARGNCRRICERIIVARVE
jgi:hypothetical protein